MLRFLVRLFVFIVVLWLPVYSQNYNFPEQENFKWKNKSVSLPPIPEEFSSADAVILEEDLDVNYSTVSRRVVVKIQNTAGVNSYSALSLPENFDLTSFPNLNRQGRFAARTIPYVYNFQILYFKARLFNADGTEVPLESSVSGEKTYWTDSHGERVYDHFRKFNFSNLQPGQILEYSYKAMHEDSRFIYYLNGVHPKIKLNVTLIPYFSYYNFSKEDSAIFNGVSEYPKVTDEKNRKFFYTFKHLEGVNYPQYSRAGSSFRHLYFGAPSLPWVRIIVDWRTRAVPLRDIFNNATGSVTMREGFGLPFFFFVDTTDNIPVYLKSTLALKKYANSIERQASDTSGNQWMSKICENMCSHKFLSAEHMHYANNNQYALSSAERLLKNELTEEFMLDVYENLFVEKKIFYYTASLSDKRFHRTNLARYDHYYYQRLLFAVPEKKGLIFYFPRYAGVKYYANELPFYFEGQACALFPANVSVLKKRSDGLKIGFTTTPSTKSSDNVRTESAVFKVSTDSLHIRATVKEVLAGQFSTLLRHFYNGDAIDSTVNPVYFKRFTDKPRVKNAKFAASGSSAFFPFKQSFNGSFTALLPEKNVIDLNGYFSFLFRKKDFLKTVNHDFYPDFAFTDSYNFLFEFDKPVSIINAQIFSKNYSSEFFEVLSDLVTQDETHYLLTVKVKVKKEMVPKLYANTVTEFVNVLDDLESLKLKYQ